MRFAFSVTTWWAIPELKEKIFAFIVLKGVKRITNIAYNVDETW